MGTLPVVASTNLLAKTNYLKTMSNRKYPRISRFQKYKGHPNGMPKCQLCDNKAVGKVEIQTSWMRGDDEYRPRCDDHKNVLIANAKSPDAGATE